MAIGHKLDWEKTLFKNSEVFECKEFPAVFTWVEKGTQHLRIGKKHYVTSGCKTVDFKKAEEFVVKKFKNVIDDFEKTTSRDDSEAELMKELEKLNLLVQCMFK